VEAFHCVLERVELLYISSRSDLYVSAKLS
jgi:hypothetical protein